MPPLSLLSCFGYRRKLAAASSTKTEQRKPDRFATRLDDPYSVDPAEYRPARAKDLLIIYSF